ncbi:TIR domain-containing protein [Pararoseomonas sp. SCSIO 73927]|uniref:TIR domain-containing protein n=1 Tax=Pararoseomonas sp. SCSIO 73927 TaxID=3114537 RepID=UPI0030CB9BE2
MAFITLQEARTKGIQARSRMTRRADTVLSEESALAKSHPSTQKWDIFLSHSMTDADVVLGVKRILEEEGGVKVFVDWVEHPQLDRSKVKPEVADMLRQSMKASSSLVFATSETSPSSKWMPWELGYFDGLKGGEKVAILPLVESTHGSFVGQEYLQLYRKVERVENLVEGSGPSSRYVGRALAVEGSVRGVAPRASLKSFVR